MRLLSGCFTILSIGHSRGIFTEIRTVSVDLPLREILSFAGSEVGSLAAASGAESDWISPIDAASDSRRIPRVKLLRLCCFFRGELASASLRAYVAGAVAVAGSGRL